MNNIAWPTAIVIVSLIGCMTILAALNIGSDVTNAFSMALATLLGFGIARGKGINDGIESNGKETRRVKNREKVSEEKE